MTKTVKPLKLYSWQHYVLQNLARYNVILAHRQIGKTTLFCEVMNAVAHAPHIRQPLLNLCAPEASMIYKIYSQRLNDLFDGLDGWNYTSERVPSTLIRRSDGESAKLNFVGSVAKPTGCTGTPSHCNIIDEGNLVKPTFIFQSALPSTLKTQGINIITGSYGEMMKYYYNHARKMMEQGNPDWFAFQCDFDDAWSKDALTDEERSAMRNAYDLEDEDQALFWNTEFANKCGEKLTQFPYREAMEGAVVTDFDVYKIHPVNLAWDDGRGVTAIWAFQFINNKFYFFDYFEFKKSDIVTIAQNRAKWYADNGFSFGVQILPHTMQEKSFSIKTRASREALLKMHLNYRGVYLPIPKVDSLATKFTAGVNLFPQCVFHTRTHKGQKCLLNYSRKKFKTSLGSVEFQDKVDPNKWAHGGDAFGEVAMASLSQQFIPALKSVLVRGPQTGPLPPSVLYPY